MGTNNTVEREISLSDLFWGILLKWRRLICCMVVFLIIAGGGKYYKDYTAYKNYSAQVLLESNAKEENTKNIEEMLSKEERADVADVAELQERIAQNREYLSNSKLMNIEPAEMWVAIVDFYVNTNYEFNYTEDSQPNYQEDLVVAYYNYATSEGLANRISDKTGINIEGKYLAELVTVTMGGVGIFQLKIIDDNIENLKLVTEEYKNAMVEYQSTLNDSISAHELKILESEETEEISKKVDPDLGEKQRAMHDRMTNLRSQRNALKSSLSDLQLELLDINNSALKEAEQKTPVVQEIAKPGVSKKFLVLGMFLGAFLACAWSILQLLFTTKLINTKEMQTMYGLRFFGEVTPQGKKRKLLQKIDNLLLKIKYKNKKHMTYDQQLSIICSNLEIACENDNIKSIYLTGSEINRIDEQIVERIEKELGEAGVEIRKGSNINYDAKSLKEMAEIGHVVFIEQEGVSLYQEITEELRVAKEQNINILGSIAVY